MKVLALAVCLLAVPSICSAHSGQLISAVSNYLPFIMPAVLGAVATFKNFFSGLFNRSKKDERDEN